MKVEDRMTRKPRPVFRARLPTDRPEVYWFIFAQFWLQFLPFHFSLVFSSYVALLNFYFTLCYSKTKN